MLLKIHMPLHELYVNCVQASPSGEVSDGAFEEMKYEQASE